MNKVKLTIKNILLFFNLKVNKDFKITPILLSNIYKKNNKKNVLISYTTNSILKNKKLHTNAKECEIAAEIFDELGFNVDIIDFYINKKINYEKYDVVYGMGASLENSFYSKKNIKKIFYATGCNPIFSNTKTLIKIRKFYNKFGVSIINSSRFVEKNFYLQTLLSNKVIVLGNSFTLNTYTDIDSCKERYEKIDSFFYKIKPIDIDKKDFIKNKKNFLWFGSSGAIHKGLDLLLEIFGERDDINLHICGLSKNEEAFIKNYNEYINNNKNIFNHGFINIESEKFKKIMNICNFVIHPSISEGGAPSVLTCMGNGGLIPIISESSGLDINNLGFIINDINKKEIVKIINNVINIEGKEIKNISKKIIKEIRNKYSIEKYKKNLKEIIKKELIK